MGNVVQRYEYDSFGNMSLKPHFIKQPFTYTAREFDPETGLYYYRARYYDAKVGRFITRDPIGFEGGINQYAYVGNNPVNRIDPFGLFTYNGPESQTGRLKGEALNLANCMESCIGKSFVVSGGSECTDDGRHVPGGAPGSKHCTNQAFDMWAAGMDKTKVFCCALSCGAKYIKDEGMVWHFQTTPGLNNSSGALPRKEDCCNN
ncbi:MAG TPA: RHS repeat-associated core domain-containing protein [Smithellaceae bacterium]|nr:RHS repeat-associated core domain-containing protein [Smithellaceae bacterium]HRV25250.1 RHS repeat-associated core domain-containing protein [Smithellaceae bacterium]